MTAASPGSAPESRRRDQSWRQAPQHRPQVNDYARDRYQQQQAGTWAPFTSTGPVREHVEQLLKAGMTREQIARAGGVSVSTLTRAFRVARMSTSAAAAVTNVQPPEEHSGLTLTPARQLQALVADGWHLEQLAEASGLSDKTIRKVAHESVAPSPRTTTAVNELYETLKWEDPGDGAAAVRSRLRAERRGWAASTTPAVAGAVDGPEGDVDQVVVDRVVAGDMAHLPAQLRPEEQQAVLRRLAGTLSDDAIADRLGVATRTVIRHRVSQGLPAYDSQPAKPARVSR